MAVESSSGGRGALKAANNNKAPKSSKHSQSMATVATTVKKKSATATKKEEEYIKLVIRRLPPAITKDELWEQMQPLPNEPIAFWFCPAPKTTDHELPRAAAFCRAYVAFREEKDAIALSERFNGYMFLDKQGNESMAIVECAPSQHLPKDLGRPAKECDIRSGTLENESQYQQFLEAYEQKMALGPRRVIDFDALVRELEDKERRMQGDQVQETPLTAYINRMGAEKGRKKQQKLTERLERRKQQFAHQIVTTDWAEVYQREGIEIVNIGSGGTLRSKEKKKEEKEKKQKQSKKNSTVAGSRNRDRPEREIYRPGKARLQSSRKSAAEPANGRGDASGGDGDVLMSKGKVRVGVPVKSSKK